MSPQRPSRSLYFVSSGEEGRVRRPRDVAIAVIGLALVAWAVMASDRLPPWAESLSDLVASSPTWVQVLLSIGYLMSLAYAIVVTIGLVLGGPDRLPAIRDMALAVFATSVLAVVLSIVVNGSLPYVFPEIDLQDPTPQFPVARVAIVTSLLLVAAPYLTRPMRRFGWVAIATTAVASLGLGYGSPVHVFGSFGAGLLVSGALLAVVGTPRGYPSSAVVAGGLETLGIESSDMYPASEQTWGLVRFHATEVASGGPLDVKVLGRDAFDSQLAAKVWRTMMYQGVGRTVSFSRLHAVEHEALLTLLAHRSGVAVPELAAAGQGSEEIALIAFRVGGRPLSTMAPAEIDDRLLVSIWQNVAAMHQAGMTHGSLRSESIRVVDGRPILIDLGLGSLAPDLDDRAADIAELLFSLSVAVGVERAVATAVEGVGEAPLVEALPYLQLPAISPTTRRKVEKPKRLIASLSEEATTRLGAEAPEPVQLRRVTLKSLAVVALLLLVGYAIIPLFTGVDYGQIWEVLRSSDWLLVSVAVFVGHLQYFPQATATMFAVPVKLPFWPLITLQTASQFISLAVPSSAGRVAMNAAFLHKFGVSVTAALAQGAIDGFSGFLVQLVILVFVLLTGNVELGLELDAGDVPWLLLLGVFAVIIAITVIVVTRVPRVRDRVVPVLSQAWGALSTVLKKPSRAIGLLASSFVYWNVLGVTLWVVLGAIGSPIDYGDALFISAGTSLFAGFMPVPGGVGVAEATMVALLATLGVDEPIAIAATAVYRVITFYLPALEGLFGTRWLERNDYV